MIMIRRTHLAVLLLSKAFQLITIKARNAPIMAIKEVEAPTERASSIKEEKRIPPIPPTTQMNIILSWPIIDSSIVPKISAKIEFEKICKKLAWRNIGMIHHAI